MSNLSDSEVGIAKSTPFLSIPELIGVVKRSFRECDYDEVQNILMEWERKMEGELEYVRRDFESYKKDAALVERCLSLEKARVEGQLQRSERKCGEWQQVVRSLEEEKGVCLERAKRAEEMCEKVLKENLRVMNERNKEIDELEGRILENEGLVGEYREKLRGMDREMVELRWGKMGADRMVEELRQKQVEVERVVEELKGRILELGQEKMDFEVVEEKLRLSERKCEELEEENRRLREEEGVCLDRAKRAEEMYEKVLKENARMMNEKNKEIYDLGIRIFEDEGLVGEYLEELNCRDARILEMDREIERLRLKQVEAGNVVEELKDRIIELRRTNMKPKGNEEESGGKFGELKEKIRRSRDCLERAREGFEKFSQENVRVTNEKNKIFELNEKIKVLECRNLKDRYKLKRLGTRAAKMMQDLEDLMRDKLCADQMVRELSEKQEEADKVMKELKARNHELGVENMGIKKAFEVYKSRFENWSPRVAKMEVDLAGMLNVNVGDLALIVQNTGGGAEEVNVDFQGNFKGRLAFVPSNSTGSGGASKKGGINLASSQSKKDGWPVVLASVPPFRVESNDTAQQNVCEELQVSGGGNLANSQSKEAGAPAVCASGCTPFHVKSNVIAGQNVPEKPPVSGSGAQGSSKEAHPSSAYEVILIDDSDDDKTNPGQSKKRKRIDFGPGKF